MKKPQQLRRDRSGALEGLPLYMIILVVIAAVAIVSILALVPRPLLPDYMTITTTNGSLDGTGLCWNKAAPAQTVTITLFAKDNRGPINSATVSLQGASIDVTGTTANGGVFTRTSINPTTTNPNPGSDVIDVTATFGGVSITQQIPVNKLTGSTGRCPP